MNNTRKHLIIGVVCVAILISSLVAYLMISNKGEEEIQMQEFATEEEMIQEQENVTTDEEEKAESASTEMGKTVEESKNEIEENKTSDIKLNETATNIVEDTEKAKESNTTKEKEEKKENKSKEPEFNMPIQGEILREFASETLVYSNTLQEWVTHNGIDIKADKTSVVSSSASGTVYAIKNDPRYGLTVIINHDGGYQTVYSNLLTAEFVVEGEKVDAGQTIGTVGNSASFEVSDDYHLHFEILKDSQYIDPTTMIN